MRKLLGRIGGLAALMSLLWTQVAQAAGEKAAALVIVADTRKLDGLMKWWADLYNESHAIFTLVTVILIPVIGLIFGVIADIIMSHIGIDLKSRELAEH